MPQQDLLYSLQKRFSTLARLDRKYFRLANRIRIARFLVRAGVKQNLKYLMGINQKELERQRPKLPEEDARSYFQALTEEAKSGPVFSEEALMAVQQAGDGLTKDRAKSLANLIVKDENPDLSSLDLVVQWLLNNVESLSEGMTYTHLVDKIQNTTQEELREVQEGREDPLDPRTYDEGKKLIVYTFSDGYFITIVPTGDCRVYEGTALGTCIKDVWKNRNDVTILSLRSPANTPRVSMSLTKPGNEIIELRGNQNKPPVPKYMKYIREFMRAGIIKENIIYWALTNKEKFLEAMEEPETAEHVEEAQVHLKGLAINQTVFTDVLPQFQRSYPIEVATNQEIDDDTRYKYFLSALMSSQVLSLVDAVEDIPSMHKAALRAYKEGNLERYPDIILILGVKNPKIFSVKTMVDSLKGSKNILSFISKNLVPYSTHIPRDRQVSILVSYLKEKGFPQDSTGIDYSELEGSLLMYNYPEVFRAGRDTYNKLYTKRTYLNEVFGEEELTEARKHNFEKETSPGLLLNKGLRDSERTTIIYNMLNDASVHMLTFAYDSVLDKPNYFEKHKNLLSALLATALIGGVDVSANLKELGPVGEKVLKWYNKVSAEKEVDEEYSQRFSYFSISSIHRDLENLNPERVLNSVNEMPSSLQIMYDPKPAFDVYEYLAEEYDPADLNTPTWNLFPLLSFAYARDKGVPKEFKGYANIAPNVDLEKISERLLKHKWFHGDPVKLSRYLRKFGIRASDKERFEDEYGDYV